MSNNIWLAAILMVGCLASLEVANGQQRNAVSILGDLQFPDLNQPSGADRASAPKATLGGDIDLPACARDGLCQIRAHAGHLDQLIRRGIQAVDVDGVDQRLGTPPGGLGQTGLRG